MLNQDCFDVAFEAVRWHGVSRHTLELALRAYIAAAPVTGDQSDLDAQSNIRDVLFRRCVLGRLEGFIDETAREIVTLATSRAGQKGSGDHAAGPQAPDGGVVSSWAYAKAQKAAQEAMTPERILAIARRAGAFSVSLRYRDDRLRRRCGKLKKDGLLVGGRRVEHGQLVFYPAALAQRPPGESKPEGEE